jgi:UDP-glucose 4-epimerase
MKNIIVVTGGAGFIGSNLIARLIKNTKSKIISIDNYFTGSKKNHIKSSRVKYINGETQNIEKILSKYKSKILTLFHFGEFSRIAQSFIKTKNLIKSNHLGTVQVIEFCRQNKIRIIYSATSAAFGNNFADQNLSPYSYSKTSNLNLILNYHEWFGLQYEIVYFYNVYGPRQIQKGQMSAVIGNFEQSKKKNKLLTIVRPGTQKRHFTHIDDTIDVVLRAFKNKKCTHYSIRAKNSYSILQIAKIFDQKFKFVNERRGERFYSTFVKKIRNKKIISVIGKLDIKNYIKTFLKENFY